MCRCYKTRIVYILCGQKFDRYNNLSMFHMCLIDVKKAHDDDLGKIETCRSFVGFCVKIHLTCSALDVVTQ